MRFNDALEDTPDWYAEQSSYRFTVSFGAGDDHAVMRAYPGDVTEAHDRISRLSTQADEDGAPDGIESEKWSEVDRLLRKTLVGVRLEEYASEYGPAPTWSPDAPKKDRIEFYKALPGRALQRMLLGLGIHQGNS